ncbi:MAG TPA: hypothetical protein VGM08_03710 [Candidatus Saccharimonadales bacterium]|jgi:hypothetical protein
MSTVAQRSAQHAGYRDYEADERHANASSWTGWVDFGGVVMILSGIFQAIAGLVGIFRDTFYVITNNSNQLLVVNNIHTWGWINLIVGVIVILAGISLFSGSTWARVVAVIFAGGAAIVNLVNMPLYPLWSIICLTLSVVVIYAVIAHGRELREE